MSTSTSTSCPRLFDGHPLWSARRPASVRSAAPTTSATRPCRSPPRPCAPCRRAAGCAARRPVRLLAHVRTLGHCFNPVSFYWCFRPGASGLEAVVAEVTNTPWGERHAYVLPARAKADRCSTVDDKALHVSPFMAMDQRTAGGDPPRRDALGGDRERPSTASGVRRDASRCAAHDHAALADAVLHRHPAMTLRVLALIYGHARCAWRRRVPSIRHPAAERAMTHVAARASSSPCSGGSAAARIELVEGGAATCSDRRACRGATRRGPLAAAFYTALLRGSRGLAAPTWTACGTRRRPRRARARRRARRRPLDRCAAAAPRARGRGSGARGSRANTPARAARADRRPLRPRQRALRALLDETMMLLVPRLRAPGRDARGGALASSTASATSSTLGPATTCSRSAPAGAASRCTPREPRLPRHDDDDLARAARARASPGCARRASRTASRSCSTTTATCAAATTSSSRSR